MAHGVPFSLLGGQSLKSKSISSTSQKVISTLNQPPMLKTIQQMSKLCGIGEHTLRYLVEKGEIDYIQIGNRKLLADDAIWDYYKRHKVSAAKGE